MAKGQTATCIELRAGGFAAHVLAPRHFAGILAKMGPGDVLMLADLRAPEPGDIAFGLVRAGAIRAIRLAMIDPLHLEARMKIVPSPCLVGVDDASSGNASANDRNGLGLMFHDCRHGRTAPLTHHHDAAAFAVLVLASTPINASDSMIFRPNMAAKPTAIDLNDPC
jgi:hypothetical protein